jgi:hypothetical protein
MKRIRAKCVHANPMYPKMYPIKKERVPELLKPFSL